MIARSIIFLGAGLVGCGAWSSSRTNEGSNQQARVSDPVLAAHADVDLTGTWMTGSTGEPAARKIVVHPPCNYSPATWIIEQKADSVRVSVIPAIKTQGIPSLQPQSRVGATGRVWGMDLILEMGSRYLIHYDSTSGHLRGTMNGSPFWAVRQDIVRPEGCIPPP